MFGNDELLTLFNTTDATATCPEYGSPLASAYTKCESKFKSELEFVVVFEELEEFIPIAERVLGPAIPVYC